MLLADGRGSARRSDHDGAAMTRLEAEFERCWQWLEAALKRHGKTHEKHHVRDMVMAGKCQLWPYPNAAIVTEIVVFPTGMKELRGWLSGGDLDEVLNALPEIEAWAKSMGCVRAAYTGRKGWIKAMPDYKAVSVVGEKEL
jgi:hypothetical protein